MGHGLGRVSKRFGLFHWWHIEQWDGPLFRICHRLPTTSQLAHETQRLSEVFVRGEDIGGIGEIYGGGVRGKWDEYRVGKGGGRRGGERRR